MEILFYGKQPNQQVPFHKIIQTKDFYNYFGKSYFQQNEFMENSTN